MGKNAPQPPNILLPSVWQNSAKACQIHFLISASADISFADFENYVHSKELFTSLSHPDSFCSQNIENNDTIGRFVGLLLIIKCGSGRRGDEEREERKWR